MRDRYRTAANFEDSTTTAAGRAPPDEVRFADRTGQRVGQAPAVAVAGDWQCQDCNPLGTHYFLVGVKSYGMASLSYPHPAAVEVAKDPLIGCQAGPEGVDVDGDLPAPSSSQRTCSLSPTPPHTERFLLASGNCGNSCCRLSSPLSTIKKWKRSRCPPPRSPLSSPCRGSNRGPVIHRNTYGQSATFARTYHDLFCLFLTPELGKIADTRRCTGGGDIRARHHISIKGQCTESN